MLPDLDDRTNHFREVIQRLLNSEPYPFDERLRGRLSEEQGLYRIFLKAERNGTLRAGRTKTAAGGLRQRVYQNHLMGNQNGNLRQQLVRAGICRDIVDAKDFIRQQCVVQTLTIPDSNERKSAEHFMLAILQPQFTD